MTREARSPEVPGPPRARVLVVDDSEVALTLLGDVVRASAHLELAGEADCGERAVQLAEHLRPEIVLIDVYMPGLGGVGAAARIRASCPSSLVVLVSTMHPEELTPDAHRIADAVIWKADLDPELLDQLWLERHRPS